MAKNRSEFQPGGKQASPDLTHKSIYFSGEWGLSRSGHATDTQYGNDRHYVNATDTACGKRMKKDKTHIFLFSGGGGGGVACCCQASSPGRSGKSGKFSPRIEGDSDHFFMCVTNSCGCCHSSCQGFCARFVSVCHTTGGHGGTAKNYICAVGACGAATVCNWSYNTACCNFGALTSGGGVSDQEGQINFVCACCYTTQCYEQNLPVATCDVGFDCMACRGPSFGYQAGSCINQEAGGACEQPHISAYSMWKHNGFRNGTVAVAMGYTCEMAQGGWHYMHMGACGWGRQNVSDDWWSNQFAPPGARACGSPCCCGSPGGDGRSVIRYEEID